MNDNILRKGLAVAIIVLFIGASSVPLTRSLSVENHDSVDNENRDYLYEENGRASVEAKINIPSRSAPLPILCFHSKPLKKVLF